MMKVRGKNEVPKGFYEWIPCTSHEHNVAGGEYIPGEHCPDCGSQIFLGMGDKYGIDKLRKEYRYNLAMGVVK